MEEFIAKCQHCGNETSHFVLHQEIKEEVGIDNFGNEHPYLDYYCFTVCNTCRNYSFFNIIDGNEGNEFSLYPLEQSIHISIPKEVSKTYTEALKVRKISPGSFLILIRKSLEIICKEQKAEGKNLKQKIEYLYNNNQLPKLILDAANSTRVLGNLSAHEYEYEWTNKDADIINDLFQAVIEYTYILPSKLQKLTEIVEAKMT